MERYAVIAVFSPAKDRVLLIEKRRPSWQYGKLNLPGGHVDLSEDFVHAVVRELEEETGLLLRPDQLTLLIQMDHPDHRLECFLATADLNLAKQTTDEPILLADPTNLPTNVMRSVRWWIGLALDESASKPIVYRDLTGHEENHEG